MKYMKCFFTNIQIQQIILKRSLLFEKNTIFTGKSLENYFDSQCKIFKVLHSHEPQRIMKFYNMHQCTFNDCFSQQQYSQYNKFHKKWQVNVPGEFPQLNCNPKNLSLENCFPYVFPLYISNMASKSKAMTEVIIFFICHASVRRDWQFNIF